MRTSRLRFSAVPFGGRLLVFLAAAMVWAFSCDSQAATPPKVRHNVPTERLSKKIADELRKRARAHPEQANALAIEQAKEHPASACDIFRIVAAELPKKD